jgi:hypothetical protein
MTKKNEIFVARDRETAAVVDLIRICQLGHSLRNEKCVINIVGMPGIGKTFWAKNLPDLVRNLTGQKIESIYIKSMKGWHLVPRADEISHPFMVIVDYELERNDVELVRRLEELIPTGQTILVILSRTNTEVYSFRLRAGMQLYTLHTFSKAETSQQLGCTPEIAADIWEYSHGIPRLSQSLSQALKKGETSLAVAAHDYWRRLFARDLDDQQLQVLGMLSVARTFNAALLGDLMDLIGLAVQPIDMLDLLGLLSRKGLVEFRVRRQGYCFHEPVRSAIYRCFIELNPDLVRKASMVTRSFYEKLLIAKGEMRYLASLLFTICLVDDQAEALSVLENQTETLVRTAPSLPKEDLRSARSNLQEDVEWQAVVGPELALEMDRLLERMINLAKKNGG